MKRLVVLDVVGLTPSLLGPDTPNLAAFAKEGGIATLEPPLPAVTCTTQSTIVTGLPPSGHGIVANGWYFRDLDQVLLWRQSERLVEGEKLWEVARRRDPSFTCAKVFWWYAMATTADVTVTPRPAYPADGRKIPDVYTWPIELRRDLQEELGPFPLFQFWGPGAGIRSTRWIADCALRVFDRFEPTLTLVYLPHLDYDLQRLGPGDPGIATQLRAVDREAGRILEHARARGAEVAVLSEYGIGRIERPVHLNRVLREAGYLAVFDQEPVGELLDAAQSRAFAVSDHQVAHVYVRDPADVAPVRSLLEQVDGVDLVLDEEGRRRHGLDHPRSGELVAVAERGHWFTYYYWLDDRRAPDFARTVDIHRKPGYDPAELFLDAKLPLVKLRIAWTLVRKILGLRYLMKVIPLDASLVRGSHGRLPESREESPVLITSPPPPKDPLPMTEVRDHLLALME